MKSVSTDIQISKEVTPEQIANWSAEHKQIQEIVIPDDEGNELSIWVKTKFKGKVFMLDEAYKVLTETKSVMDFNRFILRNTILNFNKEDLLADEEVFLALTMVVDKIVQSTKAKLEKK